MNYDFQQCLSETGEIGFVEKVIPPLVYVAGLPEVRPQEVIAFESGAVAQVIGFDESYVELVLLSGGTPEAGSRVARTGRAVEIGVGEGLLGTVIDPLGYALEPGIARPFEEEERRPIDREPPGVDVRVRITRPCEVGVSIVDLMLPLGKGQRELVIGDQKTGKSRFLVRSLIAQVRSGALGVYAVIGKSQVIAKQVEEKLRAMGVMDRIVMVVSRAQDTAGAVFLTPYSAMAVAEYFLDKGHDVFVVLDDLSVHAKSYRELALTARRFPGRNSYPGDIFYAHARLLERAGNFMTPHGERSITCLPAVEAPFGDLAGYVQTNVMSMTDGHLFFDHALFAEGRRPAIDPFLSVTRVGRQTQTRLRQEIGRELITFLRGVEKMHAFKSFGAEAGESVVAALERERRLIEFFDETPYDIVPPNVQVVIFGIVWSDIWVHKKRNEIRLAVQKIIFLYERDALVRGQIDAFVGRCDSLETLLKEVAEFSRVLEHVS